uniref:TRIM56 n=1 Tax=Magallana gigas TaxID=29159 RepID=A0A8W8NWD1_MAGGI
MATSAGSGNKPLTNSSSDDTFRCPICLEEVRNPKYLSCLHTFCESCIQTYISSTATCNDSLDSKTINCPVCRKCIDAPRKDISDEEWASSLPQNKLIVSMLLNSNPDKELCKFCERKQKRVSATHWCKACMETICNECKAFHELVPSLQDHKIANLDDTKVCEVGVEVEEFCPEHQGKIIDAFCHQHQKLCCCFCLVKHHRLCSKVETITDIGVETEQHDVPNIISIFSDLEKCIENMQEQNKTKIVDLSVMKQEICTKTEIAIKEITTLVNDAHAAWIKAFEQTHADSVGIVETASDELKRFSTTVHETKILLQSVLKSGSPKQLFVTKQNQLARINNHISHLKSLDLWNFPEKYTQPDFNFLKQLSNQMKFEDVNMSKGTSGTIETILYTFRNVTGSDIFRRKQEMSRKDWMKVSFKLTSKIRNLSEYVYYGLFVHDTKIILPFRNPPSLKIFDVSKTEGKCIHTELCQETPYGLCHSRVNESLNEVYVSFLNFVDLYSIDVEPMVKCTKLQTIQLSKPMKAISCGLNSIFSANDSEAFICSEDFSVQYSSSFNREGALTPFLSSSSKSDFHCFSKNGRVVVADGNNKTIFESNKFQSDLRGMTFDLHDNILVCNRKNKLIQIRNGCSESRNIELNRWKRFI